MAYRRVGRGPFLGRVCRFNEVNFRERDDDAPHPEINQNLQMFFRLRHPAVISRDNEQREIDRADAATMFLTKSSCPGTSTIPMLSNAVRHSQFKLRKPQLDRDARSFSSGRRSGSVPVSARTSALFAVINVPGRCEDEPLQFHFAVERSALTTSHPVAGKMVRRSSLNFPPAM